ncbi:hypothetical protein D3C80_1172930 [compost metagenome]
MPVCTRRHCNLTTTNGTRRIDCELNGSGIIMTYRNVCNRVTGSLGQIQFLVSYINTSYGCCKFSNACDILVYCELTTCSTHIYNRHRCCTYRVSC